LRLSEFKVNAPAIKLLGLVAANDPGVEHSLALSPRVAHHGDGFGGLAHDVFVGHEQAGRMDTEPRTVIRFDLIVYLALAADRPTLYLKMRRWVREWSAVETSPLPAGVVLSRFDLPKSDQEVRPWQKAGELLRSKFHLPQGGKAPSHVAIAGTIDAARQFQAAGLRTLYLGAGGELLERIERVAGWEEMRRVLEK
jgi:hypothetical protein